jgi:hypothetical protein
MSKTSSDRARQAVSNGVIFETGTYGKIIFDFFK